MQRSPNTNPLMENHHLTRQLQQDPEVEHAFGTHPLQAKASGSVLPPPPFQLKASSGGDAPVQKAAGPEKENNTGLPDQLKEGIEGMSGMAMDDVKVHYNSDKPAQLQAHAYAQGTDIHVAPGQEQHLPHEAWHVVQQKQGRVEATTQLKGKVAVNDDEGLEHEADVMGAKAMQFKAGGASAGPAQLKSAAVNGEVAQMVMTRPRSVAMDMHHDEYDNIFDDHSEFDYLFTEAPYRDWSRAGRISYMERQVQENNLGFSYNTLSNDTLDDAADLATLATGNQEKMYVHDGDTIHTAKRTADEKKPHPTLVGGDPDVNCAGTLDIVMTETDDSTTYTVGVTNDSGHFRPDGVPQATVDKINEKVQTDLPDNTTITVNNAER